MPPYRRYFYKRRYYKPRRRNRFYRRRTGKTFRRKWRKPRRRFYKPKVKKYRKYKKKKLKLTLKVFQPKSINFCKIIGYKCLFQGSLKRAQHNYIQYIYSTVPPLYPGGGGWSLLVFSLSSLYEDFQHLQNYWTKSNVFMPLVRYLGCKFKFYQSSNTDYIVNYDNCWPMVDGMYTHANSSPLRMIQHKNKIVIPSSYTQKRKKPYKSVFIKPPAQMTNNWYFQRDVCNLNLVMLTATSVNLRDPFAISTALSNNITVTCLSPYIFQNTNFQHFSRTEGYYAKKHNGDKLFLYANHSHLPSSFSDINHKKTWFKSLIPLLNTKEYQAGATMDYIMQEGNDTVKNWGNPFYFQYLHYSSSQAEYSVYYINKNTSSLKTYINSTTDKGLSDIKLAEVTTPQLYILRYNPEKDTGQDNKVYLVKNDDEYTYEEPENKNLIFDGFPLFTLLWGWTDWIKKTKIITNLDINAFLVIKTKMFSENLPYYILIDQDFTEGEDPYTPNHTEISHTPSYYNAQNWYPRLQYQEQNIQTICDSGPAAPKSIHDEYIQAYCKYTFYFKWGGCPKQLPKVSDPCSQSKWPTANNINSRLEISNPNEPPQTQIYSFDWEQDYIKEESIQRVQDHTRTHEQIFSITESKNNPQAIKIQTTPQKETKEEQELKHLLYKLQHQRMLLELKLRMTNKHFH
nr:MAG: ORF1 [TTV-like mini virus]